MSTQSWVTPDDLDQNWLTDLWPSAAQLEEASVEIYLASAQTQCVEFLGDRYSDGDPVPHPWRLAQLMQARALSRVADTDSGDQVGPEGIGVTIFPMDWQVKRLLVPERRIGGLA